MPRLLLLVLSAAFALQAPADTAFYTVSYIEVTPASRAGAVAAFRAYRDASRRDDGYVRLELFEQAGRRGHFAIVEAWRNQKAFDARGAAQKQLGEALQPARVSDYDQRPYKTLAVGAGPLPAGRASVYVIAHVDVSPDPQVAVLLKQLAEDSRRDEGNMRFDVLQHTMRANHFTVIEAWRDQKALDAHVAAAHTRQYRDTLAPMTGSPLDERVFEFVE